MWSFTVTEAQSESTTWVWWSEPPTHSWLCVLYVTDERSGLGPKRCTRSGFVSNSLCPSVEDSDSTYFFTHLKGRILSMYLTSSSLFSSHESLSAHQKVKISKFKLKNKNCWLYVSKNKNWWKSRCLIPDINIDDCYPANYKILSRITFTACLQRHLVFIQSTTPCMFTSFC